MIVISKSEYNDSHVRRVGSIHLYMDLTDYVQEVCLEFEITIRILKNN